MGHKLKIKCVDSRVNVHSSSSTGAPFTLTTVQVPNLALIHKKRITVYRPTKEIRKEEHFMSHGIHYETLVYTEYPHCHKNKYMIIGSNCFHKRF
jgi:hypothetical protein